MGQLFNKGWGWAIVDKSGYIGSENIPDPNCKGRYSCNFDIYKDKKDALKVCKQGERAVYVIITPYNWKDDNRKLHSVDLACENYDLRQELKKLKATP